MILRKKREKTEKYVTDEHGDSVILGLSTEDGSSSPI